jgi:hypothetical protein
MSTEVYGRLILLSDGLQDAIDLIDFIDQVGSSPIDHSTQIAREKSLIFRDQVRQHLVDHLATVATRHFRRGDQLHGRVADTKSAAITRIFESLGARLSRDDIDLANVELLLQRLRSARDGKLAHQDGTASEMQHGSCQHGIRFTIHNATPLRITYSDLALLRRCCVAAKDHFLTVAMGVIK